MWGGVRGVWRDVLGECGGEVLGDLLGECGEMCRVSVEDVGKVLECVPLHIVPHLPTY